MSHEDITLGVTAKKAKPGATKASASALKTKTVPTTKTKTVSTTKTKTVPTTKTKTGPTTKTKTVPTLTKPKTTSKKTKTSV